MHVNGAHAACRLLVCRLWSREVQANLSVYRGHMLPGAFSFFQLQASIQRTTACAAMLHQTLHPRRPPANGA